MLVSPLTDGHSPLATPVVLANSADVVGHRIGESAIGAVPRIKSVNHCGSRRASGGQMRVPEHGLLELLTEKCEILKRKGTSY